MSIRRIIFASLIFLLTIPSALSQSHTWQRLTLRGNDYVGNYFGGSFVTRADGKILVTYRVERRAMISVVDSEDVLFGTPNASAANERAFYTYYSLSDRAQSYLQKIRNGHILLYIVEPGVENKKSKPFKIVVYESANGLGTDFVKRSTIYSRALPYYSFGDRQMGMPIEIGQRILIPAALPVRDLDESGDIVYTSRLYCIISTDGGRTWSFSQIAPDNYYRSISMGFGVAKNKLMILAQNWHGRGKTTLYTHDLIDLLGTKMIAFNRPSWDEHRTYRQRFNGDMTFSHFFYGGDGYTYLLRDDYFKRKAAGLYYIFRRPSSAGIDLTGQAPYQTWPFGSTAVWGQPLNAKPLGDDLLEVLSVTPRGSIAMYGTSIYGGGSISHLFVGKPVPSQGLVGPRQ